ncbi:MAG: transposase [Acutalibacteraceae bacterium]|nr:transposase [Acutalibacteraceae bacterium]
MPRSARRKSNSGIYHIMLRGINRQQIFEDIEDNQRFLDTLLKYREQCGYVIYAYCLMGNHIHILLKEGKEDLAVVLKRIAGSYVYWYNWKYHRIGHLFQDRFKSEPVEDDAYFLTVLRYIHQNPIKAGLCKKVDSYQYSSFNEYFTKSELVDTDFALSMISREQFIDYHLEENSDECLEIQEDYRLTDDEAREIIVKITKCKNVAQFQQLDATKRKSCIQKLYIKGLSIRQISRLTGVSKKTVENNIS